MKALQLTALTLSVFMLACEIENPHLASGGGGTGSGPTSRSGSRPYSSGGGGGTVSAELVKAVNEARAEAKAANDNAKKALAALKRIEARLNNLGTGDNPPPKPQVVNFDHSDYDALLGKYVKDGLVDYKSWKANDLPALDKYLERVRATDPSKLPSDKHRMAFWINVYNAWTLRSMLKLYPTDSILKHTFKATNNKFGIWDGNHIAVNGQKYTLNDIEHKVLRPMGDPRIHFGIVCASIGCPPLASDAYVAERLGAQLDASGRKFFADDSKFKYDAATKTVYLSQIFKWFGKDFGPDMASRLKLLSKWVTNPEAKKLMQSGEANVKFLDYDWGINAQS